MLAGLISRSAADPRIRAVVLTSSRARPGGPVDLLSDYDVILAVSDVERFLRDDEWLRHHGEPMVRWGDKGRLLGQPTCFRGVVYTDYVKIDYSIWPVELLTLVAFCDPLPDCLDVGYRVLLDKDGAAASWRRPTYRAHIPDKPSESEFRALVEEFWWDATYVAKSLWRGDIAFARWILEDGLRAGALRRMLEWRIEVEQGWSMKPGVRGRGLQRLLPPGYWAALDQTYTGAGTDESWLALNGTAELFRQAAKEVAAALGYGYPADVDGKVSEYTKWVAALPPSG